MTDNEIQRQLLYRDAIRAALLGLAANLTLGVVKLVAGVVGGSFALISDAVNSLGDSLSSIIVVAALYFAQRPADKEHPYGHSRAEGIAATNVALLIILSALFVGWEAIQRMMLPHQLPQSWTLWVAGGNVIIKESLYWYNRSVGKRVGSSAVLANAWDHRTDALCSLAVLVGLAIVRFGGPDLIWADEAAALIVVCLIIVSGVKLFRGAASELMDLQAGSEWVQKIRRTAEEVTEVKEVETLWVRKSGLEYFVDIHIEVRRDLTVDAGHRIGHAVKDRILKRFPQVRDVLVHLEPHPHRHDELTDDPPVDQAIK